MPRPTPAPPRLALARGTGEGPRARAAAAVLESLHELVVSHRPGWHEGPGALVPATTWLPAVRRLADDLLRPAAGADGLVATTALTERALVVADALYGERPPTPAPDRAPWPGRLLVVLGCGRSGTTWLERMLLASPHAGGVDGAESFLFKVCHPLWRDLAGFAPLTDREQLVRALRRFCDAVLEAAMAEHSPEGDVFVEKTPMHSLMVEEVAAVYPEAHFLHLIRDGRDVARSISQVEFFGIPDPADAAVLWRSVLERVRAAAPSLRHYREVRYEDLLTDPVEGVRELLAWAGLRNDGEVVPELVERAGARVSSHAGTAQAVGRGTWRSLDRRDLGRVLGEAGGALVREGYLTRPGLLRHQATWAYWSRRGPRLRSRLRPPLPRRSRRHHDSGNLVGGGFA